ncbi:MAG: glycosyltransferase family 2 protein [Phycisphaerales bacterium]|nr:glycosyltransferase family 2 protein [Phycisphaerales bacterium]
MSLLIVIVNYRTPELTTACLASLSQVRDEVSNMKVVVIDNGSSDGSADAIDTAIKNADWGEWAMLARSDTNLGFAAGNNAGLKSGTERWPNPKYVLLLNSDTVVHRNCLQRCYDVMEADTTIGVMSCKVLNKDGSLQNVARLLPNPLIHLICSLGLPWRWRGAFGWADTEDTGWDRQSEARDVGWLGGAFLFIRGDLVKKIGLLDDSFFFYGEDIEFSHRIWRAGYRVHYHPGGTITHYGGGSSDPVRITQGKRSSYMWASRYQVQRQCYGRLAARFVWLVDVVTYGLRSGVVNCMCVWGGEKAREKRAILATSLQMVLRNWKNG